MADYLSKAAAEKYFELSRVSFFFGLISETHWTARIAALRLMCEPDDALRGYVAQLLGDEFLESKDQWDEGNEPEGRISDEQQNRSESTVQPEDDFPYIFRFCPAGSTGLSQWVFHQYDPDYFPSIPHGHYLGKKQPKLDAYLGYIYHYSKQTGREPRKKIIALWNDQKFRDFALDAIKYYLTNFPGYRGWRVPNPRRLPRRRP